MPTSSLWAVPWWAGWSCERRAPYATRRTPETVSGVLRTAYRVKLLVVEPYFGGSHRAWAEGFRRHSRHEIRLVTHPASWWKWRMRGAAVTLAEEIVSLRDAGWEPDVVMASDMVDLPALRSFAGLERTPVALYFHESQLSYPDSPRAEPDLSYAFTNWLGALAADAVFFNSGFHLEVFFEEAPRLLRHFPDRTHEHLIPRVRAKSEVLPVGVELGWFPDRPPPKTDPPLVMWNHRWEHDKGPEEFVEALVALHERGSQFRVALCGENSGQAPEDFESARRLLGDRVVHYGFAPLEEYRRLLLDASVIVSTARQEFFGVSVVEGIAAGARPVLPSRLSYPWLIPEEYHSEALYRDGELTEALERALSSPPIDLRLGRHVQAFSWESLIGRYDQAVAGLASQKSP